MVLEQLCELDRLLDEPETRIYLKARNIVAGIDLNLAVASMPVVVKRFPKPNFIRQIIYSFLIPSKAIRSWSVAHYLLDHGLLTPKPLAILHCQRKLLKQSYFVTEQVNGAKTLRDWRKSADESTREKERDLAALADYVRRLHRSGVYHKDLTAGNFLLRQGTGGQSEIFLVDLNRARVRQKVPMSRRLRDLARLKVCHCPTEQQGVKFWQLGCGLTTPCEKQRFLRMYFQDEAQFERYKRASWYYQVMSLAGFRFRKSFKRIRVGALSLLKGNPS